MTNRAKFRAPDGRPLNRLSLEERIDCMVDRSGGPDSCWPWLGASGRPQTLVNGWRTYVTHVLMDLLDRPEHIVVRHTCDNPPCCNPSHLVLGTQLDNVRDRVERGRSASGSKHPKAKLNEDKVLLIRNRLAAGGIHREIAEEFGVAKVTIDGISRRREWAWVK